jgi:GNAT superfamily N-acetyltransferase
MSAALRTRPTADALYKGTCYSDADVANGPPGFAARFRDVPGTTYRLYDTGNGCVVAHQRLTSGRFRAVGYLSWFGGTPDLDADGRPVDDRSNVGPGIIHKAYVSKPHRRRGIATALLTFAREQHPNAHIRHSGALSADGRAFARAVT